MILSGKTPIMRLSFALLWMFTTCISLTAEETASGVVGPLDNDGMYVITSQGQTEVRWNKATQVAIKILTAAKAKQYSVSEFVQALVISKAFRTK